MLKVRAVKTSVSREEPVGVAERVGANHKIGDDSGALSPLSPVNLPRFAGHKRSIDAERAEFHIPVAQDRSYRFRRGKIASNFRPNDFAGDKLARGGTRPQRLCRTRAERRVSRDEVQDDVTVNGGEHVAKPPLRGAR